MWCLRSRMLVTCALLAVGAVEVVLACISPPGKSGNGFRPSTDVTYQFVGSWGTTADSQSETNCVTQGIDNWTQANSGGSRVRFVPAQSGSSPMISISKQALGGSTAGGTTSPNRDGDGYITGLGVQFTTNTNLLDSCEGFKKVAMHEFGHAQNLDDTSGSGGSSVMNQMSGKNDGGGNIPTSVTGCDMQAASSEAPPPPYGGGTCDPTGINQLSCIADGGNWDPVACSCNYSPILIRLGPQPGYRLTSIQDGVRFDYQGDGVTQRTAWTAPNSDVALLALDRNRNGRIDSGAELFGNFTSLSSGIRAGNGFEALADLEAAAGVSDGVIDANDPLYHQLLLWVDRNHNGRSEPSELTGLASRGITVIDLAYWPIHREDRYGNLLLFEGTAIIEAGNRTIRRDIHDVYFRARRQP